MDTFNYSSWPKHKQIWAKKQTLKTPASHKGTEYVYKCYLQIKSTWRKWEIKDTHWLCLSVHNAELKGVSLWWKLIGELHRAVRGIDLETIKLLLSRFGYAKTRHCGFQQKHRSGVCNRYVSKNKKVWGYHLINDPEIWSKLIDKCVRIFLVSTG